jgi:hypothetical protein
MHRLLVLETPWDDDIKSTISVGPFLLGLRDALPVKVVSQQFNGKRDLEHFLREFSAPNNAFSHCYIASHGSRGRLLSLIDDVNSTTIANACRGCRGRGFLVGACAFGNARTAGAFLSKTGADFVAGYSAYVPWMESMFVDLLFLTYLFRGRARTESIGRSRRFAFHDDDYTTAVTRTANPLKVAKWVYEDLPIAKTLGLVVHRRRPGRGRAVIEHYP